VTRSGFLRAAVAHFGVLVLLRLLLQPDEWVNWDLIPLLNANVFPSLAELLRREEIHFRQPWSFPLYNIGSESAVSAVLLRGLGAVSLYWSNALLVLVYTTAFMAVAAWLLRLTFADSRLQGTAWLLLSMSPVVLTFAATSAFNMQGYLVLALAMLAMELYLQRRRAPATATLAGAALLTSQGYALGFFWPYYALLWIALRLSFPPPGSERRALVRRAMVAVAAVAALTLAVHALSGGRYLRKLVPLDPGGWSNPVATPAALAERAAYFIRQAVWSDAGGQGPVGFAPYLLWLALLLLVALWARRGVRVGGRVAALAVAAATGILALAYAPAVATNVVKSQRAFLGDFFLAAIATTLAGRLLAQDVVDQRIAGRVLLALVLASDALYLGVVFSVDHRVDHYPRYDFDTSDSVVRHELDAALRQMRADLESGAGLVVYYPRGFSEHNTDPALFFGRMLRHLGDYHTRPGLEFPCRWCDVRYGCPFPKSATVACTDRCCDDSPSLRRTPTVLWWWHESEPYVPGGLPEALARLRRLTGSEPVARPGAPPGWVVYELLPDGTPARPLLWR
jgi:hypothetical protein